MRLPAGTGSFRLRYSFKFRVRILTGCNGCCGELRIDERAKFLAELRRLQFPRDTEADVAQAAIE